MPSQHDALLLPSADIPFGPLQPRFLPLDLSTELPHRGMLLGIDAEFVAFSTAEKTVVGGMEVVTRPARLGLARVSVVRGEGSLLGACLIDDHVRTVEPVVDYLTRFSGVQVSLSVGLRLLGGFLGRGSCVPCPRPSADG